MQRLVRDILGRLRPTPLAELGLMIAVLDLAEFWRARRPEIHFETGLTDVDELPEPVQEILYRIVQESLSNAVRHSAPRNVRIAIEHNAAEARVEVLNDGASGGGAAPGYGLTGMSERVAAAGGALSAGPAADGGWRVAATLPLTAGLQVEAA
jgi:two-component system sensor histidine kinase UhpB